MDENDRWQQMVCGLRSGDPRMTREFCDEYGAILHQVAKRHLPERLRRRVGPEDVVQSACRTFLRRTEGGEFQLTDSAGLWQLLCAITVTKVREQARFHLRRKRGVDLETEPDSAASRGPGHAAVAPGPAPDEAAAFSDQFQLLLAGLDDEERQIVQLKLEEHTNEQVAERLGCSERTIRRILKRVQSRLTAVFEVA